MDFKDLRPATLYNFIQSVKFGTSIEDALVQAYSIEAGFLELSDSAKDVMLEVCEMFNKHVLGETKIDVKYLWSEQAPEGYFINIGKEVLEKNYNFTSTIATSLIPVFERLHDIEVSKLYNSMDFKINIIYKSPDVLKSLPFVYGGVYNLKDYALPIFTLLVHLGLDIIDLDDNLDPIFHDLLINEVNLYVQEFIDKNLIYLFKYAKKQIMKLPYEYKPIQMEMAIPGKEKYQQRRLDLLCDENVAAEIIKIVGKVNKVFAENFWIPKDEEE